MSIPTPCHRMDILCFRGFAVGWGHYIMKSVTIALSIGRLERSKFQNAVNDMV